MRRPIPLFLHEPFQRGEHLFPVLFGVFARFFGRVIILSQYHVRLIFISREPDGDGVIVFWFIREPGKRAEMNVLERSFRDDMEDLAFVFIRFPLPFSLPGDRAAFFSVRGNVCAERILFDRFQIQERIPDLSWCSVD